MVKNCVFNPFFPIRRVMFMIENFPHHSVGFHYTRDFSLIALQGIGLQILEKIKNPFCFNAMQKRCVIFLICLEGEIEVSCGSDYYYLFENDSLLISLDDLALISSAHEMAEFFYFEFTKEACQLSEQVTEQHGCCFSGCTGLVQPAMDLYQKALRRELTTIFINSKTAHSFLIEVISELTSVAQRPRDWVMNARNYMESHYRDSNISLDLIAKELEISKYHLCKEFKNRFDVSPGQFLKELRLQEAVRLLKEKKEYSIEQIARSTGYATSSYFGKVFKKNFGMTPDEFRKKIQRYDIVEDLNLPGKTNKGSQK